MEEEAYLAQTNMWPGKYLISLLHSSFPNYVLSAVICGKDVQVYLQWGYLSVNQQYRMHMLN